jgi:HK97 family phage portal protein
MLGRLLGGREARTTEGLTYRDLWLRDDDLPWRTMSGVSLGQRQAMTLTAVYDAVRVISDPISTFPVGLFIRANGERKPLYPRPAWIDQPDPDPSVMRSDHYQQLMVSLLLNGNYYGRKVYDSRGDVLAIRALDPTLVEPVKDPATGMVFFLYDGTVRIAARDIVHITDLRKPGAIKGTSRIDELREPLGIGKALDEYVARYFGQGTVGQRVVISVPGEMDEEQAERLKDNYESKNKGLRNSHRPNVISGGGKIERLSDNAEQAQLSQAREFFVMEVARAFKLPPSKLGVIAEGTRSYASVEQDNIDFATTTLQFYVAKIEEAYSRLVLPSAAFIRLNMDSLLRGDITSRYTAYNQGIAGGFLTAADIRRREDLAPIDGAEVLRVPLENIDVTAANLVADQKRVQMFQILVQSGVEPAAAAEAVGLPPMAHTGLPSVQLQQPADPGTTVA